jgi:hypothetical protein
MSNDLSRKEEQRGTRNVMKWGVAFAAVIFVALIALALLTLGGGETSPVKRADEQNSGANAPSGTLPPAGTQDDGYGNTELPEQ